MPDFHIPADVYLQTIVATFTKFAKGSAINFTSQWYVGIQKSQRSMQRPIEGRECDFFRAEKLEKVVCYLVK